MQSSMPMAGKLVLDMTQGIAGPYCGRLLAEHGARVIKVEPPEGDWVRQLGGGPGGVSVNYLYYNLGKESVTLDLKSEGGLATAQRIAANADVVAESARPGVMERLGLGYDAVSEMNPDVVYLSVSGFGQTGPRGPDPMTDTVAQAFSGMMSINPGLDGIPHKMQSTIVDAITGLYAYQQVSMALMAGRGVHVDVSLMQAAAAILGPKVMEFAHFGRTPATPNAPAGTYPTADGWIAITLVRETHFAAIARAISQPTLSDDPRFKTFASRLENLPVLVEILNAATRRRPTADWVDIFAKEGVLASAILDFGEWLAEPQVHATQGAPEIEVMSDILSPAPRTPGRVPMQRQAPEQGNATAAVLAEFGGTL